MAILLFYDFVPPCDRSILNSTVRLTKKVFVLDAIILRCISPHTRFYHKERNVSEQKYIIPLLNNI